MRAMLHLVDMSWTPETEIPLIYELAKLSSWEWNSHGGRVEGETAEGVGVEEETAQGVDMQRGGVKEYTACGNAALGDTWSRLKGGV